MINSIIHKSNIPTEFLPHTKKLLKEDSLTIRVIKVASIAFLVYAIVLDISYNVNRLFSQKVLPLKQKPQSTNQKALFKTAMKAIAVIGAIAVTYAIGRSFFKRKVGEKIIENIISAPLVSNTSNFGLWAFMAIPAALALRCCFSSSRNIKELNVVRSREHVEVAAHDLQENLEPIEIDLEKFQRNPESVIPDLQRLFDRHRGEIFSGTEKRRVKLRHSGRSQEDELQVKFVPGTRGSFSLKQIFDINGCPLIFKLCRHTQFGRNGKLISVEGDRQKFLIDVERRMKNYQRAVEEAEDLDRIVIPKTAVFNYELGHRSETYTFPVLAQEKINRATKSDGSPFLVSELFESPGVNETEKGAIFFDLFRFLTLTGFKDVREENLYVVWQDDKYKIAIFDFEEMDDVDTALHGCDDPPIPGLIKIIPDRVEQALDRDIGILEICPESQDSA